jgi:predicted nucleotidyltransferase
VDRDEIARRLREILSPQGASVVAAYLFGSHARGEAGAGSDVDVGLLLPRAPLGLRDHPFDLGDAMERSIGASVDLVVLNDASADLVHRVLRDGVLLHESDREARVEFEVRKRNEYFDLRPMLEAHRRALIRSA